jgi:diketogulonate reductase-like aldo/keto reductase
MGSAAFLLVVILSLFGVSAGDDAQCSELVVPPLLIGCWKLMERERDPEKVVSVLMQYAEAGYTTFDTADIYGPSERVLGLFRSRYAEKYGAEEAAAKLRFFTKYVTGDTTKENAEAVNAASLQALGVDALDLVQFHWWDFESSASFLTAANELVALQLAGKIKHIGVTNFDVPHLSRLIEAKVPVKVNQVQVRSEYNLKHLGLHALYYNCHAL